VSRAGAALLGPLVAALLLAVPVLAEPSEPPAHAAQAEHGAAAEHGEEAEHESEFNWAYGFIGEKEGVEPGLAYRPKGMAPPFLANLLNAAILFAIIVLAGKKPIAAGLRSRKERIVQGMEEAGKMKAEAATRLAGYEEKLERLGQEIERIHREMRETAEAERVRILAEARDRRERMERDARLLIEQELKAAHQELVRQTVSAAVVSAQALVAKELGSADHDRLAREYLDTLRIADAPSTGARP
jgi:F-type H+-transporting ATPase subunit b